jgi:hypothetical protein
MQQQKIERFIYYPKSELNNSEFNRIVNHCRQTPSAQKLLFWKEIKINFFSLVRALDIWQLFFVNLHSKQEKKFV